MTKARVSYELPCDLSEKQIESDFALWLGHLSTNLGEYRLLDVDERLTGADKQLKWSGVAYYFQFKKPTALTSFSASEKRSKREDERKRIRRFRHENELEQTPYSVCFQLRAKAKTAADFQHNVLKKLESPPRSRALYVCPLEYSKDKYLDALRDDGLPWFYFEQRGQWLIEESGHVSWLAQTHPFLRGHAAIAPHCTVADHKHYYSFSAQATDVAFHSPELVSSGPHRFSDFVAAELRRGQDEAFWSTIEALGSSRGELAEELGLGELEGENALARLQSFGRLLREKYGIRQVVLLRASEMQGTGR